MQNQNSTPVNICSHPTNQHTEHDLQQHQQFMPGQHRDLTGQSSQSVAQVLIPDINNQHLVTYQSSGAQPAYHHQAEHLSQAQMNWGSIGLNRPSGPLTG